jgi:hypothetical protein
VYLPGDAFLSFVLRDIQIVLALKANPEFCGSTDIPGKTEGQFCADRAPPTDQRIHGSRGYPQALRNR